MATTPVKIKRSQIAHFLNTTPGDETATYARIGPGVPELRPEMGPQNETNQYIHEDTATSDVIGYEPSISVEMECIAGDAVFDYIEGIYMDRAVLDDAVTDLVEVYLYKTPTNDKYPAIKQAVAVEINQGPGGPAREKPKIAYTLRYRGDPVPGVFDPSGLAFTPNP